MLGLSIAYKYDLNGYFVGSVECQEDQLASIAEGKTVYLLPANATFKEPLQEKEGFRIKWNGENWVYIEINPAPTPEEEKQREIAELKEQLAATDYKIIKCSEYSLNGQELPYNIAELHAQRQALRDRINELEK